MDNKYIEICSERTIFSEQQGFFGEMFEIVKNSCTDKWLKTKFETLPTDAEKLRLLYDEPNVSDMLLGTLEHVIPVYRKKDCPFSYQRRKQGESLHQQNDLENALILLTHAVLRAPPKGMDIRHDAGLTLALALWSRSAVLLDLNRGKEALDDIQSAIDNGLIDLKKQLEYYVRLARANAMIGNEGKTKICLNLVKSFCGAGTKYDEIENQVKQIKPNPPTVQIEVPQLNDGENEMLKHATKKIEIRSTPECGNFVVASEAIQTGEMIVVEKPIAACLLPKFFGSHCLHCLRRIEVAYACPNCAGVAFCSIDCQKEACSTYHAYECKFMDMMIGSGMSILCFIALRTITQYTSIEQAIQTGRQIVQEFCTHSNQRKATDYLQRAVMSAFLLRIMQKSNYFGRRTSESGNFITIVKIRFQNVVNNCLHINILCILPRAAYPNSEQEFKIGEILIGLLQALQFNAHEIYETKAFESQQNVGGKKMIYIGAAIYNSAVYFNHSCSSDVIRHFVGTSIVLSASHPIQKDETISENYGPIYTKQTLAVRQRNLKSRYWFQCTCVACKENWPTFDKLTNKARLRCSNSKCNHLFDYPINAKKCVKCPDCKEITNLEVQIATLTKAENLYYHGAEYMDKKQLKNAAKLFIDGINLFYSVAVPPHRDTYTAQESLRVCLSNLGHI